MTIGDQGGGPVDQENMLVAVLGPGTTPEQVLDPLSEIPQPGTAGAYQVRSAAVVRRDTEGKISIGDHLGDIDTDGTMAERHPRLAGLLTALLAPLDTLVFGNTYVALTGAVAEPSPDERVLIQVARAIPHGGTAVIADVVESDQAVIDSRLAGLDVTLARRPLAEVEAELGTPQQR